MKFFMFYGAVILTTLFPTAVFGHGVEVYDITGETGNQVQIVYFKYSTGEPMMYAKIKLYPPSQSDAEILQSISDRNGYFSFVPDEQGDWRIDAEDGMGHKGSITITVSRLEAGSGEAAPSGTVQPAPLVQRILLGLSLILNVFAVYGFIAHRRKSKGVSNHAH
jgi:nickel transport protein